MGWTPLFLKAEPASTGVSLAARVARRIAAISLAGGCALEVELHHLVVGLRDGLDKTVAPVTGRFSVGRRDLLDVVHLALFGLGGPDQRLHRDQVDKASEVSLGSDRDLQDERHSRQPVLDHVDAAVELRPGAVELVDEADAGNAVAVRLPPHRLALGLDTCHAVEDSHGTVEDAQRRSTSAVKSTCPGVSMRLIWWPSQAGGRGRGDRDAALLLLGHPVHRCRALGDLADLVVDPCVEQDPLGRRGLAGIDVRHDADVADLGEVSSGVGGHGGGSPSVDAIRGGSAGLGSWRATYQR